MKKKIYFFAIILFFCCIQVFPQNTPWEFQVNRNAGNILLYHFDRADREIDPLRWFNEARNGLNYAYDVWAEMFPEIFNDARALNDIMEWSENELEKRFTQWLLERFFGRALEASISALFMETEDAFGALIFYTGEDGLVLYDERTGDPMVIRPGDERFNFNDDLIRFKNLVNTKADNELFNFNYSLMGNYTQLLTSIGDEHIRGLESLFSFTGEKMVNLLRNEFNAILIREERYFTAQRLGDVWSLRRRSEDQSAELVGQRLIDEAKKATAEGIASIETKIEAARGDGADISLNGTQWLEEYREQFYRGLRIWEMAEEQFLQRRIEWEQTTEMSFQESLESWISVFARFEEERQNWEEQLRVQFIEGEKLFLQASNDLEAAISFARTEFIQDRRYKTSAAAERSNALTSIFVLNSSTATEARKNIDFWINEYKKTGATNPIPETDEALFEWIENEKLLNTDIAKAASRLILDEIKNWLTLYKVYSQRAEESLQDLRKELYHLTGSFGISDPDLAFNPDFYTVELIRLETELNYWKHREAVSEAVYLYSIALDAGRVTAAETIAAWEIARNNYDFVLNEYQDIEFQLRLENAALSIALENLSMISMEMRAADEAIDMLKKMYAYHASNYSAENRTELITNYQNLQEDLHQIKERLNSTEDTSVWNTFLSFSREMEFILTNDLRMSIIRELILGDSEAYESLAQLAQKYNSLKESPRVQTSDLFELGRAENELQLRIAAISLIVEENSLWEWYITVTKKEGFDYIEHSLEEQLLLDWESARLEYNKAKEELDYYISIETDPFIAEMRKLHSDLFLYEYILKMEFAEALFFIYLDLNILSPIEIKEEMSHALNELQYLWNVLGIENNFAFLPETDLLLNKLNESNTMSYDLFELFYILDDIFLFLPPWLDLPYNLWQENILNCYFYSDYEELILAERHRLIIETELFNLFSMDLFYIDKEIIELAEKIIADPLLLLNEDIYIDSDSYYDTYVELMDELLYLYFIEQDISIQLRNLEPTIEMLKQGGEQIEAELAVFTDAISAEENKYLELLALYQESVENFNLAAALYDKLYEKTEAAYKEMEYARKNFEIEEAIRLWAETAYLDSRKPWEEYIVFSEKAARSENIYNLMLNMNINYAANDSYTEALKNYENSMSIYSKSLDVKYYLENNLNAEIHNNAEYYRIYWQQLNLFGKFLNIDLSYESPDDRKEWGLLDIIGVNDKGQLIFAVNENNIISGADSERIEKLFDYFNKTMLSENELYGVTPFELALRDLADTMYDLVFSKQAYINLGLARDYLIYGLIKSNSSINNLGFYFSTADSVLSGGSNLGNMPISSSLKVHNEYAYVYMGAEANINKMRQDLQALRRAAYFDNYAYIQIQNLENRISFYSVNNIAYLQNRQWSLLDNEEKDALEFYTILSMLGGGGNNSENFSRISEYMEFAIIHDVASQNAEKLRRQTKKFLIGGLYKKSYNEVKTARDRIAVSLNELSNLVGRGYDSLSSNLLLLRGNLALYKNSSEIINFITNESEQKIVWEDIEKAMSLLNFDIANLTSLKVIWEEIERHYYVNNIIEAVYLILDESKQQLDNNYAYLSEVWDIMEEQRFHNEVLYKDFYYAYMNGNAEITDIKKLNELGFGEISHKMHIENLGNIFSGNLNYLNNRSLGAITEYEQMAHEYSALINMSMALKYDMELLIKENQWDIQRRDLNEKFDLWNNSARTILEQGRISWRESEEKLNIAFNNWKNTFESEYKRINEQWTFAYLDGLKDKEDWANYALEAANNASSAAIIALIGASAESGARAFYTRDPMDLMLIPNLDEGEKILSSLFEKSGTNYLEYAFNSIRSMDIAMAANIRSGLNYGGIKNYGTAMLNAAILVKEVRGDFEEREAQKMAHSVMQNARNAYDMAERNVIQENTNFRNRIDDIFIISGQWRRSGSSYTKNVIVHSTLFNSMITEYRMVESYRDFLLPETTLLNYINGGIPSHLDQFQTQELITTIYEELNNYIIHIFDEDNGLFKIHIGENPVTKASNKINVDKGRDGVFDNRGSGESGRLISEYLFYMYKEGKGIALMSAPPWEKPMWDSRGWKFEAPSIKTVTNIALTVAGAGIMGSLVSDLVFTAMDLAGGYKNLQEAGLSMGKSLLSSGVSVMTGNIFSGNENSIFKFAKKGGFSGLVSNDGIWGDTYNSLLTGTKIFTDTYANNAINSFHINEKGKLSFEMDQKGALWHGFKSTVTGVAGDFTTGILNAGIFGFTNNYKNIYDNAQKLSSLAGGLVSQGINYAFGEDFTLNVFNFGFKNEKYSTGILELRFNNDGPYMQFGTGGVDASFNTLRDSFKGLEAWKVNAQILFSSVNSRDIAIGMRTLYSGNDTLKEEFNNVLAGRTVYLRSDENYTLSQYDERSGVKFVYLGQDAFNTGSPLGIGVVMSHEAYRDGVVDDNQIQERERAIFGHSETAFNIRGTYGENSLSMLMTYAALAYDDYIKTGNSSKLEAMANMYDSTNDYWRLLGDGTLVSSGDGWLKNENNEYIRNADGEKIGAAGIETGLLNILFGGTSNVHYDNYSDEQIALVQAFMIEAGMIFSSNNEAEARTRYWGHNPEGISLNMSNIMNSFSDKIASQVFANYFGNTIINYLATHLGYDIGNIEVNPVPSIAYPRYVELFQMYHNFFESANGFLDHTFDYYISLAFNLRYNGHYRYYKYKHYGMDLSREGGSLGDSIYAGISGIVSGIDWNYDSNGHSLEIQYGFMFEDVFIGSGIYGQYLHMIDPPDFNIGNYINSMTEIGQIGGSPYKADGKPKFRPHLHYAMLTRNERYNNLILSMFIGNNFGDVPFLHSFLSIDNINRVYNPAYYYNHFLGITLPSWEQYRSR